MNASAIGMLIFGATLLWGGLVVALSVAVIKGKKSSSNAFESEKAKV